MCRDAARRCELTPGIHVVTRYHQCSHDEVHSRTKRRPTAPVPFGYVIGRDLQRSRAASLTGAIVFALGGFFYSAPWPEVMGGYLWTPLVFLFLLRVLRADRSVASAALCGLFLGAAWLSGHHEIPIYLSFTVAAAWLYHFACDRAGRARLLRLAAIALLIAILTSGFQTVPGYEYARLAQRWVGADHPVTWNEAIPYAVDTNYSYPGTV